MISVEGIKPKEKLFHNERVKVYEKLLPLNEIKFWIDNNRTIFTFHKLERELGKKIEGIQDDVPVIASYLQKQHIHKLDELAASIEKNGVQIPLILLDDGTLLDGNRRFFACHIIKLKYENEKKELPYFLNEIPVFIIKSDNLKKTTRLKILAEENFIADLKLPWSLDAQARAIHEYYLELIGQGLVGEDEIIANIQGVFGISKQRIRDFIQTLEITFEFIEQGKTEQERVDRRTLVEEKFVYFWEFLNKAMKGRSKFVNQDELIDVKNTFFNLMAKGKDSPIKNVKQVEPLALAKRDKTAWSILKEDNGAKLSTAISIVNDKRENRRSEDRIRIFIAWLEGDVDLSDKSFKYLDELAELIKIKMRG